MGGGQVARREGVSALWKGMSPALLRQATYGSMRYGLYTPIKNLLGVDPARAQHEIPLLTRVFAGAASGALASAICNPADLIKVQAVAPDPTAHTRIRHTHRSPGATAPT